MKIIRRTLLVAALAVPFADLAVTTHAADERFVFVSHAPDSDSWWNVIENALKNAEHDMGVKVEYRNPPTGDIADMARIIQQATASNPDGLVSTIADFDVLQSAIQGAVAKGIPVITVNSGTAEQSKKLGAMMHIGQPEYDAGKVPANAPRRRVSPSSCASTTTSPTPLQSSVVRAMPTASAFRSAIRCSTQASIQPRFTTRSKLISPAIPIPMAS